MSMDKNYLNPFIKNKNKSSSSKPIIVPLSEFSLHINLNTSSPTATQPPLCPSWSKFCPKNTSLLHSDLYPSDLPVRNDCRALVTQYSVSITPENEKIRLIKRCTRAQSILGFDINHE